MKHSFTALGRSLLAAALAAGFAGCALAQTPPAPITVKIIGFNDFHGNLQSPGTFDGANFKWLSANVIENATGNPLLAPYGVKSFNGVKVAFIGMTLKGTPGIVTPTGVAGLTFKDEADTVNALVPKLRAQGIE